MSDKKSAQELFNRQYEDEKLEFLKARVDELLAQNEALKISQEKSEKDTHEFVAYFQRELAKKDDTISSLTEKAVSDKVNYEMKLETTIKKHNEDFTALRMSSHGRETDLSARLKAAEEELTKVETFCEMKDVLEQKLETLQAKYSKDVLEAQEMFHALERRSLEERSKLKRETNQKIEKIKQESREEARNGLDADTRKIVTDNKRMGEELRFQLQTTQELEKELKTLEESNKELNREISIHNDKEEEYARQGHQQNKEIKTLQAKIKSLEKSLSQVVHEFEREKNVITLKNQRELEDSSLDVEGLRRLLKIKSKELRTVKRLAQTILDQRTDVEQFFLESLDVIKKELIRERKEAHAKQVELHRMKLKNASFKRNPRFPNLRKASIPQGDDISSKLPKTPSEKVDIRDLTWEDRERVLRLLFAKINSVQGILGSPKNDTGDGSHIFATQPASITDNYDVFT